MSAEIVNYLKKKAGKYQIGGRDAWIAKINQSNIMYVNRFRTYASVPLKASSKLEG